jgi:hypothetical protein
MSDEEKNMLKAGEKIPFRRQGGTREKKAGGREGPSREAQASGGVIEAQEARTGREEPGMPVTLSKIVSTITNRTGHVFSAYKKGAVIRGIQRRMRAARMLNRQK